MATRTYAYLGLGSNFGDRLKNLKTAIDKIDAVLGKVVEISRIYESEAVGFKSDNLFLNAAVKIVPNHSPGMTLEYIKQIETNMGRMQRKPGEMYSDRNIDIDILMFGSKIYKTKHLNIPHEKLADRMFVLKPLVDIAPNAIVPGFGITTIELLGLRHDFDSVKLYSTKL